MFQKIKNIENTVERSEIPHTCGKEVLFMAQS
jgi:hypothetical protein